MLLLLTFSVADALRLVYCYYTYCCFGDVGYCYYYVEYYCSIGGMVVEE